MTAATGREPVDNSFDRVREPDAEVGAFVEWVSAPESRADEGPLAAVALAVKDVIDVGGLATRLGTPGAGHRLAATDADVVASLRAAGARIVGKTRTDELALGMITPGVRNPFDCSRTVGGSSGGSAAAVATGAASAALGTDTAGSSRCPAALCGVVGLKPTTGLIAGAGVAELSPSQDTVGFIAGDAGTCARLLRVACGDSLPRARRSARLGVDAASIERASPAVAAAVRRCASDLHRDHGVGLVEVRLPAPGDAQSVCLLTILYESARVWAGALEADPAGFGPQVRAALTAGAEIPEALYRDSRRRARELGAEVEQLFRRLDLDAVLTPTSPITAAALDELDDPPSRRRVEAAHSRFTALASVIGAPAVSVPCGLDEAGLPVGAQLLGPSSGDLTVLALATLVESTPGAVSVVTRARRLRRHGLGDESSI